MWRAPDQESLSLQSNLLLQQQQETRTSHDSLFQRHHSGPQDTDCARTQASEQNHDLPHGLQQALLSEAAQGPTADLSNMQLDLDNVTLATALGLGSENVLAQFHRTLGDQAGQSPSELNAVLAASLGGQESIANTVGRSNAASNANHMLPQDTLDRQSSSHLYASASIPQLRSDLGDIAESDNQSDEDEGSAGGKRKARMTEEDKKRRRQEVNRQSARRIRERRSHEMERLKQQNAELQQSQTLLLKYASTLAKEKNMLVQRTLELTERWNQAAAENLELRGRIKLDSSANNSTSPATSTYHHNPGQAASQVMPP